MRFSKTLIAAVAACVLATSASAVTLPKAAVTEGFDDYAPFSQRLDIVLSGGFGQGTFTVPADSCSWTSSNAADSCPDLGFFARE